MLRNNDFLRVSLYRLPLIIIMILKFTMVLYMECDFVNQMESDELVCRFVHASDLHIGNYQYTNPNRAMDYIHALRFLLENVFQLSSDFLLLGGDVFNSIDLLPFYFAQVVDTLRKFYEKTKKQIPIIAIEGNHDIRSFSKGTKISSNHSWLEILSDLDLIILLNSPLEDTERNIESININEVNIFGNTYCGEKIDPHLPQIMKNIPSRNEFNILLNHVGIEGQMEGIPGQDKKVLDHTIKSRIHYLGLGHFHRQYIIDRWIYNPGCLIPACISDFNLPHGYFLVDVTKSSDFLIEIQRKQLPERSLIWHTITFKVYPKTKREMIALIIRHLNGFIRRNRGSYNPYDKSVPILCLRIRSPSAKPLSTAMRKEIRDVLLQTFTIIECNVYQDLISYKPLMAFCGNIDNT